MTDCPECGATAGLCEARFHRYLALEYTDAAYGAVHHLTVAAYMVQHSGKLTLEGWRFERELLRRFLEDGVSPQQVRRESRTAMEAGQRQFKIRSASGRPLHEGCTWSRTIMDVREGSPARYRSQVIAWAQAVLADSEHISMERHEA